LKHTSLFACHVCAGAAMVPFAGWEMPISYKGTVAEVAAVRAGVGLFDVSHMGEARVIGPGAETFLQRVTANDVSRLASGQAQYSLLLNEDGGVIDDIIAYHLSADEFLVVLNAGCKDKDWSWLTHHAENSDDITLEDISDQTALIAVQGPEAVTMVRALIGAPDIARFHAASCAWQGRELRLSRTGYTGEDGFEIFCPWDAAEKLWEVLTAQGAIPCGLGARDVLRLEAAYPLYGHELDAETNALECGVGWAIKTNKGEFIGREAILAAKTQGPANTLAGLKMAARAIPREGCTVLSNDGDPIGRVTSGTFSPTVGAGIALARLGRTSAAVGTEVQVDIRGRLAPATVIALPFYRNGV
jgi:aminomethyltransferase